MLRAIRLKFLFLFILSLIAVIFVLPSFTGNLPSWWEKHVSRGLKLGLDLKGGMNLILQVDMESAIRNVLSHDGSDMTDMAQKRGLTIKVGNLTKEALPVTVTNRDEQAAFQKLMKEEFPHLATGEAQRQDGALVYDLRLKPQEVSQLQ
jgi:SecD/SecF fusion protein